MRLASQFLTLLLFAATCAAQNHTPQLSNGTAQKRSAASGLEAAIAAATNEQGAKTFWVGYEVATTLSDRMMCCFNSVDDAGRRCCGGCRLEGDRGSFINGTMNCATDRPEYSYFFVMARVAEGQVVKVRSFSPDCQLDAANMPVIWLTDVAPQQSLAWLRKQITRADKKVDDSALHAISLHQDPAVDSILEEMTASTNPEKLRKQAAFWLGQERGRRGYEIVRKLAFNPQETDRLREHLTFVLSQSREKEAIEDVIRMAKNDSSERVRGQALFWLAQKAGRRALETITEAMENDPNLAVKKKAVFALGQMRDEEGFQRLMQVAQTHPNRIVRKEAIFWLGESRDPRALDLLVKIVEGKN
jgi:HEAT repeat protein